MHDESAARLRIVLIQTAFLINPKAKFWNIFFQKLKKCLPRLGCLSYTHCELSFHLSVLRKKAYNYNLKKQKKREEFLK